MNGNNHVMYVLHAKEVRQQNFGCFQWIKRNEDENHPRNKGCSDPSLSQKTGRFLALPRFCAARNIPLSHANNLILFCVCWSDARCSALVFPFLLSIFHVSESASILGAPSLPPATNWLSKHNFRTFAAPPTPAIFFLTLPLPHGCGRGEAVTTVALTPGPLFSSTIHLWAPRCGFGGRKWCLQHIPVNFQQGFCTFSSGNCFSGGSFPWPLDNLSPNVKQTC